MTSRHRATLSVALLLAPMIGTGCAQLSPRAPLVRSRSNFESKLAAARQAESQGDLSRAKTLYGEVHRSNPANAESLHRLGVIANQQNQLESADHYYRQAYAINPNNPELLADMGFWAFQRKDYEHAEAFLEQSVRLKPTNQRSIDNLAIVRAWRNKDDSSLATFRMVHSETEAQRRLAAIQVSRGDRSPTPITPITPSTPNLSIANSQPQQPPTTQQTAPTAPPIATSRTQVSLTVTRSGREDPRMNAARLAEMRQDFVQARKLYGDVHRTDPRNADCLHRLGVISTQSNQLDDANHFYQRSFAINPNNAELLADMGFLAFQKKDYENAEAYLEQALRLKPENQRSLDNLAIARAWRRKDDASLAAFRMIYSEEEAMSRLAAIQVARGEFTKSATTPQIVPPITLPQTAAAPLTVAAASMPQLALEPARTELPKFETLIASKTPTAIQTLVQTPIQMPPTLPIVPYEPIEESRVVSLEPQEEENPYVSSIAPLVEDKPFETAATMPPPKRIAAQRRKVEPKAQPAWPVIVEASATRPAPIEIEKDDPSAPRFGDFRESRNSSSKAPADLVCGTSSQLPYVSHGSTDTQFTTVTSNEVHTVDIHPAVQKPINYWRKSSNGRASIQDDRPMLLTDPEIQQISSGNNSLEGRKKGWGVCLVSLFDESRITPGLPEYSTTYQSRDYRFSSSEALLRFCSAPQKYTPAVGGLDVVSVKEQRRAIEGSMQFALWYHRNLYLFSSRENADAFCRDPRNFVAE